MLLLKINRKAYKERPMISSHMTLSDLERSNYRNLTSHKVGELGHMLILNIARRHIWRGVQ